MRILVTTGVPPLLRAEAPHKLPIRTLVAASVGNAVEWYDWTVYATFSIYFATQNLLRGRRVAGFYPHVYHLRPRLLLSPTRWPPTGPIRRP